MAGYPTTRGVEVADPSRAGHLASLLDRAPPSAGSVLPPLWHWIYCISPIKRADLGPDGHERLGISLPQFPAEHRMWAGGSVEWHHPIRVGDLLERESRAQAPVRKEGRSGSLWFLTIDHVYRANGSLAVKEEQVLVYRDMPSPSAVMPQLPASGSDTSFDDVTLIRYSALTINSHRIHFDRDYCGQVMGDRRLVVHAPLLATVAAAAASDRCGPLARLDYRLLSPTREGDGFAVVVDRPSREVHIVGNDEVRRLTARFVPAN